MHNRQSIVYVSIKFICNLKLWFYDVEYGIYNNSLSFLIPSETICLFVGQFHNKQNAQRQTKEIFLKHK